MDDICLSCLCSLDLPTAFNHALFHAEIPTYSQPKLPISNKNDYSVSPALLPAPSLCSGRFSSARTELPPKFIYREEGKKAARQGEGMQIPDS